MRCLALVIATLLMAACSRNTGSQPTVRPDDAPKRPAETAPAATAPTSCNGDSDCHWDNECVATACLPGPAPPSVGCKESAPKPGACRCLAGTCATVYAKTSGACASNSDCDWDDACMPRRCERRPKREVTSCDKSFPPPGACVCVASVCASVAK